MTTTKLASEANEAAHRFNTRLARVDLTQVAAARVFGVDARSVRRWASGDTPVPDAVTIILYLIARKQITLDEVDYFAGRISDEELDARRDLEKAKRRLAKVHRAKIEAEPFSH